MIEQLFYSRFGVKPDTVEPIAGAGSNRRYVRLAARQQKPVIGVEGTSREENDAFIYIARHLKAKQLPVPEIYAVASDGMAYLQEDLGELSLFDAIKSGRESGGHYSASELKLIEQTIRLLPHVQVMGAEGMDWQRCYPQPSMDSRCVMFDLNYFKYCFLKATETDFHELRLDDDFRRLASEICCADDNRYFLYRDFQARNIMLKGSERLPYLIDFQGARRGAPHYDVASFLWQASARYSDEVRRQMIDAYYDEMSALTNIGCRADFEARLSVFVLFRLLQVLGAYGFRGYFERKPHFLKSIPPALESVSRLLNAGVVDNYAELKATLQRLLSKMDKPERNDDSWKGADKPQLVVRVGSFSYKKGIPDDPTGNGGGYVFDCRSTHNPGRYEQYMKLTGLDRPVRDFLETDGEILQFLEHVAALVDHHVERYIERGFTSLMISFGCTGGRHRSVYSADYIAHHINEKYGVEVRLCHCEQNINVTLPCKQ